MTSEPPVERLELAAWCRRRMLNHFHPDKPTGSHMVAQQINAAEGDPDALIALAVRYKFIKKTQVPKPRQRRRKASPSMLTAMQQQATTGPHDFSAGLARAEQQAESARQGRRYSILWDGLAYMEQEAQGIPPAALMEPVSAVTLKFAKDKLIVYCEAADVVEVRRRCLKLQRDITAQERFRSG